MSLRISGGLVVASLDPPNVVEADVSVQNGRIVALGPGDDAELPTIDATGCVVVPGNVNAHMHAYSALARGMPYRLAPATNFLEILQRVWWRLDRALDADSIRASALVAGAEALRAGTTTLVDHHASPNAIAGSLDVLADAFEELGVRSVLAYEATDRDGAERARAGIDENERFLRHVGGGGHPLARGLVGAHASFTLSDATLARCVALARDREVGLHVHVAEDGIDRDAVARLAAAGGLDRAALVAHAVHVGEADAEALRRSGATIAHNPRSNMNNGVGRAPVGLLGEHLALGTDGIGSDMWEEGRVGYLRRREEDLATGAGWPLGRLAAGSRFAGHAFGEPLMGRITPGAPADLVVLEYDAPTTLDANTLAGHWIFGLSAARVRDVVVAGEIVVRNRRLARVDEGELAATARRETAALWSRLEMIKPHPFTPSAAATMGAR